MSGQQDWLQNASFDPNLLTKPPPTDYRKSLLALAESSEDEELPQRVFEAPESSLSRKRTHDGSFKEKQKRSSRKHRKEHRRHKGQDAAKKVPFSWAEDLPSSKARDDRCLDNHSQADNLVYQKTYAYDKPAFRRYIPHPILALKALVDDSLQSDPRRKRRKRFTTQASKRKESDVSRAKLSYAQDASTLRRQTKQLNIPLPTFIPIGEDFIGEDEGTYRHSQLEAMRERTIAFNKATSESPEDLQNWLGFVAFQDEFHAFISVHKEGSSGRADRTVAEKKVDILQKALKYHPRSVEIICQLCLATKVFEDLDQTKDRYEDLLRDGTYSHSAQLWKQYLNFQLYELLPNNRGLTTVPEITSIFDRAMKALAREQLRALTAHDSKAAGETEAALKGLLVDSIRVSMQAGYLELAVAKIQAVLEFVALGPNWSTAVPGPGGDFVRRPLFEEYWNSGAPLIGEEACSGWQSWALNHQNPKLPPPPPEPDPADLEPGGWSGWKELEIDPEPDASLIDNINAQNLSDSDAEEDARPESEEDEEERLSRLLEEEARSLQSGVSLPPEVLQTWLKLERRRERCRWLPKRGESASEAIDGDAEEEGAKSVVVSFSDIEACLFTPSSQESLEDFVESLLCLIEVPVEHPSSSVSTTINRHSNTTSTLSSHIADVLFGSSVKGAEEIAQAKAWLSPDYLTEKDSDPILAKQGFLLWHQADESRHTFVRRLLALLLSTGRLAADSALSHSLVEVTASEFLRHAQPQDPSDEMEAEGGSLAVFEDRNSNQEGPEVKIGRVEDLRDSLSGLLQQQSEGSPLWTAYATHEMLYGNIKRARRSFDAYLKNLSQGKDDKIVTAPVVLAYAKSEIERGGKGSTESGMHVLCWLASSDTAAYQPAIQKTSPSPVSVSQARRGFQAKMFEILSSTRAAPSEDQAAFLLCASVFEQLASPNQGSLKATQMLRNVLAQFPPEVRKTSKVLEEINLHVCRSVVAQMLSQEVPPKEARMAVTVALQDYPGSLVLARLLIDIENRSYLMTQLRVRMRSSCEEQESVPLWLLTACLEYESSHSTLKVQQFFKLAGKHEEVQHSPLWQRVRFAFSTLHGHDNLDITYANMTDSCPWAKAVWLDGFSFEGNHKYRLAEAERREIHFRTSLEEVIYALAGSRLESRGL